jgi:GNAT superfamily N-acetyltransferase
VGPFQAPLFISSYHIDKAITEISVVAIDVRKSMPISFFRLMNCTERQISDIIEVYVSAGWWKEEYDAMGIPKLVENSFCFFTAQDADGQIVGMGRALSDGVSVAYIQDLAVLPIMRGMGIGSALLSHLTTYIKNLGISCVMLMAQPGTFSFYSSCGWKAIPQRICLLQEYSHDDQLT